MNCPTCNLPLVMSERSGIEIDYCPKCRGVWLDRGELDKIIEKSESANVIQKSPPPQTNEKYYHDDEKHYKYGRKKKSMLGELFDF